MLYIINVFFFIDLLRKINFYQDYTRISEFIYLGNIYTSQDKYFFKNNNIKVVVNCSKNIDFINLDQEIYKYRINLNDDLAIDSIALMSLYMKTLIPIINNHINNKQKILIHCRAGMQRSAAVVAALLMYRYNIEKKYAMNIIRYKRPCSFLPFPNFNLSLHLYQNYLKNKTVLSA